MSAKKTKQDKASLLRLKLFNLPEDDRCWTITDHDNESLQDAATAIARNESDWPMIYVDCRALSPKDIATLKDAITRKLGESTGDITDTVVVTFANDEAIVLLSKKGLSLVESSDPSGFSL